MEQIKYVLGFDIGGTKCACLLAKASDNAVEFLERAQFDTVDGWENVLNILCDLAVEQTAKHSLKLSQVYGCGISCGGPMDSAAGIVMSPPNLKGWDNVNVTKYVGAKLGIKCALKNDADACAIAEWKYGAGKGFDNVIFLTFGTGLGAGLILGGKLYSGSNTMAGEVGHIRLADDGPIGYGKKGSFEGFCSGGGIRQLTNAYFEDMLKSGKKVPCYYKGIDSVTAKILAQNAKNGDKDAISIYNTVGSYFGRGLSVLIDILNPQIIIAGGVYMRSHELIDEMMYKTLREESISYSLQRVKIVPSQLREKIGDYGAIVSILE